MARVLVDVPLAHLDRPFDYAVPATMAETAVPGARVKVRFAGQDVDGFVVERARPDRPRRPAAAAAPGGERRAGADPEIAALARRGRRALRRQCAPTCCGWRCRRGTRPTEKAAVAAADAAARRRRRRAPPWGGYRAGDGVPRHLADGGAPRAVWTAAARRRTGRALLAHAAAATLAAGRGALICVPDRRDVARVDARADRGARARATHVTLTADAGPGRALPRLPRGQPRRPRIVVGTRAAAFAPVHDLGLVVIWDDGDDLHAEPRAPYPHTREVLLLRAEQRGRGRAGRRVRPQRRGRVPARDRLGPARSPRRADACASGSRVAVAGAATRARPRPARAARMPRRPTTRSATALETARCWCRRRAPATPPSLACERCRTPARCRPAPARSRSPGRPTPPACRWCGTGAAAGPAPSAAAAGCGRRSSATRRTAEELGRAFPGARSRTSAATACSPRSTASPAIVVATPGAEPVAEGGYAAVVLLDTWLLLARTDLRAAEEALRRWFNAAALVRPGGRVRRRRRPGAPGAAGAGALGPGRLRRARARRAARRPACRRPPGWPRSPAAPARVDDALTLLALPPRRRGARPGRRSSDDEERAVVRVPRAHGAALSARARRAAAGALGAQARRRCGSRSTRRRSEPRSPARDWPAARSSHRGLRGRPAHPPVRRPGAAHAARSRWSTSTRSCARWSQDLTDTMLEPRRGPGRAADRRRAARLHLERRRRGRPPDQPGPRARPRRPGRRRGLPVDPRS